MQGWKRGLWTQKGGDFGGSSEMQNHRTVVENKMNQGLLLIKPLIGMEAFEDYFQLLDITDNKQISK